MKKICLVLVLLLAFALCLAPCAMAAGYAVPLSAGGDDDGRDDRGVGGGESGSNSGSSGSGGLGAESNQTPPSNPVVPGPETDSDSGGTGAGSVGTGSTTGDSGSAATAGGSGGSGLRNRILTFLRPIERWIKGTAGPWTENIMLPWLKLNWRWLAAGLGAVIVIKLISHSLRRARRHRADR